MPPTVLLSVFPGREVFWLGLGAAAGICFFCWGLLLLRRSPAFLISPLATETDHPPSENPQLIRLSSIAAISSPSIEMTSQARIAAALSKAGIASPSAWANSESSASASTTSVAIAPQPAAHPQPDGHKPVAWKVGLMICGGPALTLTCLYLLLAELGWL